MNYLDIGFLALAMLIVYGAWRRGLFVSLLSLVRAVLGVAVGYFAGIKYSQPIYSDYIKRPLTDKITAQIEQSSAQEFLNSASESAKALSPSFSDSQNEILKALEGMSSPAEISQKLVDSFLEPVVLTIVKAALFFVCLFVISLIFGVIISFAEKRHKSTKEKAANKFNSFLGALFGFAKALISIYIIASLLLLLVDFIPSLDENFIQLVKQSRVVQFAGSHGVF